MSARPDRITVRGLRVRGHHGVFADERRFGQDFFLDVTLEVDTRAAAAGDDLEQTVDYGALTSQLAQLVAGDPVNLIETLAQRVADRCLAERLVQAVEVTVHKPQAPVDVEVADIAVSIRRERA